MLTLLLCLASAVLLVSLAPPLGWVWLAPFALTPLLYAMHREHGRARRFLSAWAAGIVYWFVVCVWIQDVLFRHGGLPLAGSWAVFLLFALAKGLHLGVFGTLAGPLMREPWAVPAVAALWAGLERTHGPLGFTWLTLGDAGIGMSVPMRLAPFTGVYGLSFAFATMAAVVAMVALRRRRQIFWLAALVLLLILPPLPDGPAADRQAAVIQPNISPDEQWTAEWATETRERMLKRSVEIALSGGSRPEMILWPEMPFPLYYSRSAKFREELAMLTRATSTPLLAGVVNHNDRDQPLNSAVFLAPSGDLIDTYDKINLVPFGEFVPPFFGFVDKVSTEAGTFAPGNRVVVFPVGNRRVGAFICYESAFPDLVRQFVDRGATVLVNLSNDGYFSRTAAREQHLKLVRMRAAENRRWILRATNDGITAAIDPAGRIIESWPRYVEHAGRLGYAHFESLTVYSRIGDWFAWLCLILALCGSAWTYIPKYRPVRRP